MRLRIAAGLVGLNVVLVLAGWFLLVAPQRSHASSAAQKTQQIQDELARLGESAATHTSPRQPRIVTADLYRLEQAMPDTADQADLLLALDQIARAARVKVVSLAPQPATAAVGYDIVPVDLGLQGDYASLTRFLERLRGLVSVRHGALRSHGRLFSVTSVALTPATGKQESASVAVDAFVYGAVDGVTPLSSATSTDTTGTDTTGTDTTATTTTTSG